MSKKSRKRSARYAELSRAKQRKRKQLVRSAPEPTAPATKETQEVAAAKETAPAKAVAPVKAAATTSPAKAPAPKTAAKVQPGGKQAIPNYRYVRDDLKRIGILTGAIIIILIILAFVLG